MPTLRAGPGTPSLGPGPQPGHEPSSGTLADFLERRRASVVDVVAGAAPGTRRLVVASEGVGTTHVVAVATTERAAALDAEERVLARVPALSARLAGTLPHPVGRLVVDERQVGSVMTAVPGLGQAATTPGSVPTVRLLTAVDDWLDRLWRETAGDHCDAMLALDLVAEFGRRHGGSPIVRTAVRHLGAAQDRIAEHPVGLVMVHGCLCRRHLRISGEHVIGVDDWGAGSPAANPLLDLAGFTARLAHGRLQEVLHGRSAHARALQRFVARGLTRLDLPRQLWRDVLLLGQFRLALDALDRGETEEMSALMKVLGGITTRSRPARPEPDEGGL